MNCDNCNYKLEEKRFYCLTCEVSLCERCELLTAHEHPMLKVPSNYSQKQLKDIKMIYESQKSSSRDLEKKVELLKNVLGNTYPDEFYQKFANQYQYMVLKDFGIKLHEIFG